MLTLLGFAMVITFMYLIMSKRLSALIALIIIPIVYAIVGGFAGEIGPMMLEGITKLAPTGVMLMFAILYFALMIDSGLFDPAVRKILKLVKGDPLKVSVGTAVLALVVSLDGDGATTYMICVAAMLPLYQRLGMSPRIMAGLIILAGGVMNMTPWGGPTARAASALHVDPSDIFVPMIPAMVAGVLAILAIAYFYGKRERARLGELHLPGDAVAGEGGEISVSQFPEARRPKLLWFNAALTVVLMVALIKGLLPLPVLFMLAFGIAMIVNYPCLQQQKDRVAAHSANVLAVVGLIFAAGIFTGILSGTGMVDAMSKSLLAVIPEA
ncbi:MAG: citrate:proton symporter, partial [Pseudomonas sp.]